MQNELEILEAFLAIQVHTMFSAIESVNGFLVIHNDFDQTPYWNYALCTERPTEMHIRTIEKRMRTLQRKPAIYFPNTPSFHPLIEMLKHEWQLHNEDSWMFFEGTIPENLNVDQIKKVSSSVELEQWLTTLDASFLANDPQNPYGTLGTYIDLARRAWKENNALGKFEYVIAFDRGEPVAVATLTYEGTLAYISNVGSRKDYRGKGYGKLVTLYCVLEASRHAVSDICLATEEGTYPNSFYKKIGFRTRFSACNYAKNDNSSSSY
ncbi:MAG: GNAT family N-acetyltransferase [Candidatus Pacebacteria bacterium]|nr:GNAT family N-acetyltransferase [Candidatus Paceibacterota bacterium]